VKDPGSDLILHQAPPGLLDRALRPSRPPPARRGPLWMAAAFLLGVASGGAVVSGLDAEPLPGQAPAAVPVRVVFHRPGAQSVGVAGSWNGWSPELQPMVATGEGYFVATLMLPHGRHEYMFVVDGEEWVADPLAPLTQDDGFGKRNAVLEI
jgi:Glycogen recognition site of AMP-activated protein kinase